MDEKEKDEIDERYIIDDEEIAKSTDMEQESEDEFSEAYGNSLVGIEDDTENDEEEEIDEGKEEREEETEEEDKKSKSGKGVYWQKPSKKIFISRFAENLRNNIRDIFTVIPQVKIIPLNLRVYSDIYDIFVETICELLVEGQDVNLEQLGVFKIDTARVYVPVNNKLEDDTYETKMEEHVLRRVGFKQSPMLRRRIRGETTGRYLPGVRSKFSVGSLDGDLNQYVLLKDKDKETVHIKRLRDELEKEMECSTCFPRSTNRDINYRKEIDPRYAD